MNTQHIIKRGGRVGSILGIMLIGLIGTSIKAAERLLIPEEMVLPMYVTGLGHTGLTPDDLVGTAFYYPPDQIPGNFDLWSSPVFDPPVGTVAPYVEGFFIVGNDFPASPPMQMVLQNAPGARVPIWFTRVGDWTGEWTVNGMLSQQPLVGWADSYREVWQPTAGLDWHGLIVASGVLEDGRTFWVKTEVSTGYFRSALTANCRLHFGR